MAAVSSTSLAVTLAHAVSFLTRPLIASSTYSTQTIARLSSALETSLAAAFVASWDPSAPLRGSGRRCLSLTLTAAMLPTPPRPVHNACIAAGISWADWAKALAPVTGPECDIFIDPGCVSVRAGGARARLVTVWSAELEREAAVRVQIQSLRAQVEREVTAQLQARLQAQQAQVPVQMPQPLGKTLAQRLMEEDGADEDALFSLLADELRAPTWLTPILEQFPRVPAPALGPIEKPARGSVPMHSRSSSRSSMVSSSGFSFSSDESATSSGSLTSLSSCPSTSSCASLFTNFIPPSLAASLYPATATDSADSAEAKASRRERARTARVFVDTTKTEVTPYDGGKTTVLTGGVMLGAPQPKAGAAGRKIRRL